MEEIRYLALLSVGRAVSFVYLGIGTLVLACSFDPLLALKTGGSCSLLLAVILVQRSVAAASRDPRDSEIWAMLATERRPRGDQGGMRMISEALSLTYLRFARSIAGIAAAFFGLAALTALLL